MHIFHIYSTLIVIEIACAVGVRDRQTLLKWEQDEEIQIFREYLRVPAVQPNADYRKMFSIISQLICMTK